MAPASQREASHWVQESWININTFSNRENTFPVSIKHISTAVSWEWRRKSRNFRNSNFSFRQNEIHRNSFSFNSLFHFLRNGIFGDPKIKAQNRGNIAGETQHHHSPITLEFLQPLRRYRRRYYWGRLRWWQRIKQTTFRSRTGAGRWFKYHADRGDQI